MVRILDATLREGEQTPGVCFAAHVKLAVGAAAGRASASTSSRRGHPAVTVEIETALRDHGRLGPASPGRCPRPLAWIATWTRPSTAVSASSGSSTASPTSGWRHHRNDLRRAVDQMARVIARARRQAPDLLIRYTPEDTVRSPWATW